MLGWLHDKLMDFLHGISNAVASFFQLEWFHVIADGIVGLFHSISGLIDWLFQLMEGTQERPLWQTILMLPFLIPYWIVSSLIGVASYSLEIAYLDPERRHNVAMGIPALVMMLLVMFAGIHSFVSSNSIDARYRESMENALSAGDVKLASILGGRLVSNRQQANQRTRFTYAIALRRSGDQERSDAILADLAPSDEAGFPPAHWTRALVIAEQLKQGSSESLLKQLRWHLENSGKEMNAEVELLWTSYYMMMGQSEEAVPHLESAVKIDPRFLVALANLYGHNKNKSNEIRTLREAEAYFSRRLMEDPLLTDDRLQLGLAQARLGKQELAEETILKGVQLHNNLRMRQSAANFYLMRYDTVATKTPNDVATQFGLLEKAIKQDLSNAGVYERLVLFYERSRTTEEAEKTMSLLRSMLVDGSSPALTHFAISAICEMQGDHAQAEFHLSQAYSLDSNFPVVTNNLAWMLANSAKPDLDKAYELVQKALLKVPGNPRFRHTLATILMKQGKSREAITEFEAIQSEVFDKIGVHRNLSELYEKIGIRDVSEMHNERAIELQLKASKKAK